MTGVALPVDPPDIQYAALPFRYGSGGLLEVLLVTSRGSGQWIVPKGKPIPGLSGPDTAAQEAFEEAGVRGVIEQSSIGRFSYLKDEGSVSERFISAVDVYPLKVEQQLTLWAEMGQRQMLWLSPEDASATIRIDGLARIVAMFGRNRPGPSSR